MKRCIGIFLYCWLLIILFTSCIYDDYSGCPKKDGRKMVRINVDWHLFDKEVPTGMTVMVFPWLGGAPHTVLTNEITHADFSLEPGKYSVLVFNQSTTEFGTLDFLGMDSYETARAVVQHTTSRWYLRGDDELLGVEPEWLASDKLDEFDVSEDSSEVTLTPRNVLSQIQVSVKVPSIGYLRYARGSLTGISEGFLLGQGKPLKSKVTYLLESWTKTIDENDALATTDYKNPDANYLFVIPQKFSAPATDKLFVIVEYTINYSGGVTATMTNTVNKQIEKNFEQGKAYTINLTIGLTPIEFEADVTPWADGDKEDITWN